MTTKASDFKTRRGRKRFIPQQQVSGFPQVVNPYQVSLIVVTVGGKEESGKGFDVALRGELVEGLDRYGLQSAMNSGAVT